MDCIGCTLVKLEKNNVCVMSKWESKQKVIIGESEGDGDFFVLFHLPQLCNYSDF